MIHRFNGDSSPVHIYFWSDDVIESIEHHVGVIIGWIFDDEDILDDPSLYVITTEPSFTKVLWNGIRWARDTSGYWSYWTAVFTEEQSDLPTAEKLKRICDKMNEKRHAKLREL